MNNDEKYTPSYIAVKAPYIRARGAEDMDGWRAGGAEFDRFLARVRRDAAREALDGLIDAWLGEYGTPETRDAGIAARDYRETNYRLPEETPND